MYMYIVYYILGTKNDNSSSSSNEESSESETVDFFGLNSKVCFIIFKYLWYIL